MKVAGLLLLLAIPLSAQKLDYTRDIQPLLKSPCTICHGAAIQQNGLRLDQMDAVLRGATNGPVIIPGKSKESALIARVSSDKEGFFMPPVGAGTRLTAKEIALVSLW